MFKILTALSLVFSLPTFADEETVKAAEEVYGLRDYTVAGVQNAQNAADLYQTLIDVEADADLKMSYQVKQATAYYFMGTAKEVKAEKIAAHEKAMAIADEVMTSLGVDSETAHELTADQITNLKNQLSESRELVLAESWYTKGTSLAQWGNLKGVATSIGKLPTVIGLMDRIEALGYLSIHEYGPQRTVGRIRFKLPGILGGDLEASEQLLKSATTNTLAAGQRYSINGHNNLYFAETLYKRGKETQAKKLIKAFIEADFSTLAEGNEPENRDALKQAEVLADEWNVNAE